MRTSLLLLFIPSIALANIPSNAIRTIDTNSICTTKTDTIRHVSERTKKDIYKRDGVPFGNHTGLCKGKDGCEVDHRISLEVGGSNNESNLMIQPYFGKCNAHQKDSLENRLHRLMCDRKITVPDAQDYLYNHWEDGYKKFINSKGCN